MKNKRKSGLFGPIVSLEDAEKAVRESVKGFYALAVVMLVVVALLVGMDMMSPANLFDPLFLVINGWIIRRNKSRVLSMIVFLYSLLILGITGANKIGIGLEDSGGNNIILAVIFVYIAFRCTQGTYVYHQRLGTRVNRREAVLRSILALVYVVVALVVVAVGFAVTDFGANWLESPEGPMDSLIGVLFLIPAGITAYAAAMGKLPLTGRTPLLEPGLKEMEATGGPK